MSGHVGNVRISFNLKGSSTRLCEWRFADERYSHHALSNTAYICPPRTDCSAETDADADILSILVPAESIALALGESHLPGACVIPQIGTTDMPLLRDVQALAHQVETHYRSGPLHWQALCDRIVRHLVAHHLSRRPRPVGGRLSPAALKRVNELIEARVGEELTLDDLANAAGQSRFHFHRTFTLTMGITPHRYLMRWRLEAAIGMIRQRRLPIAAIAAETGFVDQSHLSRWSRSVHGLRPTQY
jgi:AraC family transcriptional regulator